MRCKSEIVEIAEEKLRSAHLLLTHGFVDDAYYLGGYVIELFLKAMVCKTLQIDNFFEEIFLKNSLKNPQAFKVHDLKQLLVLSGLYKIHNFESANPQFKTYWSVIISWDETHRYIRGKAKSEVENFLESINAVAVWIKRHLYQN